MTKTAFITGGTSGIGEATARRLVADGWQVIVTGRRRDRLDALTADVGEGCHPLALDMRDVAGIEPAIAGLPEQFRRIDLLVNNAGLAPPMTDLQNAEQAPIDTVIDTNVAGLVALTRALLPTLIETKGAIINLSSVAATYPYKGGAVYAGTKAFVRQFGLGLRCDLAGTGVRVTSIEPGMVETEFTLVRNGGDQAASDALYANMNPMTAEDIAETIFWVATLPAHLNINALELMPVSQSWGGFAVTREA
ncbi:SDR family NAD(P)-dependent oxidoreductase [Sphingomonas sp. LY160]|uniref:SDR family NAD(P)-dependent oxidoreductase n=1 Tax=Sphingomonas sp. LY160 TaxID=3095342 RepID=UPI002ADEBB87|nr:SDR family NAD(P)-dependent oxidoreductase [Sphingomonas sp. LY160]MEA1072327.1 SDR family NAD(P)-dependent oxidoreductase [Sphingomonas sp. LY160]